MSLKNSKTLSAPFPSVKTSGSTPVVPTTVVTDGIPYNNIWVPALAMSPNPLTSGSFPVLTQLNFTGHSTYGWKFGYDTADNGVSNIYFGIPFVRSELKTSAPLFKVQPYWVQIATTPAPGKDVKLRSGARNYLIGDSLEAGAPTFTDTMTTSVLDINEIQSGKTANDQASIAITTVTGSALSTTDINFIQFVIGRETGLAVDNYTNFIYLLGVNVQYKTDFVNVAIWDV